METVCCKAWENDYYYSQLDRFAEIGKGRYIIRKCKKLHIWKASLKRNRFM